ncbi:MAG: dTMP kinase [Pseudomonadota bacterium]
MTSARGRFITLEGGEGSGKSTQARRLSEVMVAGGRQVLLTREPGGSQGAEQVREALLQGALKAFGADVEALLFAAARADHVQQTIRPALERGVWVICDRFIDSTRVYQGALGHVEAELLRALETVSIEQARPDLTILLDVPTATGLARARARAKGAPADRFEGEGASYHHKVRAAFLEIAREEPDRCVVIDASQPADLVAARVKKAVQARFSDAFLAAAI